MKISKIGQNLFYLIYIFNYIKILRVGEDEVIKNRWHSKDF